MKQADSIKKGTQLQNLYIFSVTDESGCPRYDSTLEKPGFLPVDENRTNQINSGILIVYMSRRRTATKLPDCL